MQCNEFHGSRQKASISTFRLITSAFQFAKNNFDSIHTKKSIRIDSNRFSWAGQHSTVEWWKVGEGGGQIDVLTLIFPAFVPAAVASTVQSQPNITHRLQAVVELKGPIFWKTESIWIDSSIKWIEYRTDSNRELECTTHYRTMLCTAQLCHSMSYVCPPVCPSVTFRYHDQSHIGSTWSLGIHGWLA